MYTCGLDVGERIHGCIVQTGACHTVRLFCIPRSLHRLRSQFREFLGSVDRRPASLRLMLPSYGRDEHRLLHPLLKDGFRIAPPPDHASVDRLMHLSYRLQQAHWDRAHLLAYLAQEDQYLEPESDLRFCLRWSWRRTHEKLERLRQLRAQPRLPDWLREPTQCLLRSAVAEAGL